MKYASQRKTSAEVGGDVVGQWRGEQKEIYNGVNNIKFKLKRHTNEY